MWPSANCLHQHTYLKSCLEYRISFPLTCLQFLSPLFGNRPLRACISYLAFLFLLQQLFCLIIILGVSGSQLWHLQNLIAWHCISDITVCCHGKCHQFSMMTSLPEGEDTQRRRQHLFKHKYLWYLAKRQETTWKTTEEANIPISMMLCFGGSFWVKVRCSTFFRSSHYTRISRWLFLWLSGSLEIILQFESIYSLKSRMSLQMLHLPFSCHCRVIILEERWAAVILNRVAHLSTAFPMKPVYRQFTPASPSCTSTKTHAPISARNKPS